jgi:hypothetical protein
MLNNILTSLLRHSITYTSRCVVFCSTRSHSTPTDTRSSTCSYTYSNPSRGESIVIKDRYLPLCVSFLFCKNILNSNESFQNEYQNLIKKLCSKISSEAYESLCALTPQKYTGDSEKLTEQILSQVNGF